MEGNELINKVKKIAIKMTTANIAERVSVFLKAFSLKLILLAL